MKYTDAYQCAYQTFGYFNRPALPQRCTRFGKSWVKEFSNQENQWFDQLGLASSREPVSAESVRSVKKRGKGSQNRKVYTNTVGRYYNKKVDGKTRRVYVERFRSKKRAKRRRSKYRRRSRRN